MPKASQKPKRREKLTSLQIKKETLQNLKKAGTKDEGYDDIIDRLVKDYVKLDEGLKAQLEKISASTGIAKPTLITFGVTLVIFLASSGALQQLQSIAMSKNKPMIIVLLEFLKKFKIY